MDDQPKNKHTLLAWSLGIGSFSVILIALYIFAQAINYRNLNETLKNIESRIKSGSEISTIIGDPKIHRFLRENSQNIRALNKLASLDPAIEQHRYTYALKEVERLRLNDLKEYNDLTSALNGLIKEKHNEEQAKQALRNLIFKLMIPEKLEESKDYYELLSWLKTRISKALSLANR